MLANNETNYNNYVSAVLPVIKQASDGIMSIYDKHSSLEVSYKQDNSPLTNADIISFNIIKKNFTNIFPNIPIVCEEAPIHTNQQNMLANSYWLVDPIDGTKEFIKRNGQFTVCIALMEANQPVLGFVAAPAFGQVYYGGPELGSFLLKANNKPVAIHTANTPTNIVYISQSHPNPPTAKYIESNYPKAILKSYGSQLKFGLIAEGKGDACPRLCHTMRTWDIAAGHAVLLGAGGNITRPDGSKINYTDPDFLAGDFVAKSQNDN